MYKTIVLFDKTMVLFGKNDSTFLIKRWYFFWRSVVKPGCIPSHANKFMDICYLCIMNGEQLLRCVFPEILADYFDETAIREIISRIDFRLDERNFIYELFLIPNRGNDTNNFP